jgi:1-acyl-sn-glycerol-3-phosphate acyltransferase
VRPLERKIRLALFLGGTALVVAVFAAVLLPLRLVARVSPRLGRRIVRPLGAHWVLILAAWARAACRVRLTIEGDDARRAPGPLIAVSNHQSIIDIIAISRVFWPRYPSFVAKEAIRKGIPNVSPGARLTGCAFISRRKGDERQKEEIGALGRRIEADRAIAVIFPEGTRGRGGALGPFKAGGLGALLRNAPSARVVPIAVDGSHRAATFASLLADFPGLEVKVRVGAPIEVAEGDRASEEGSRAVAERCRSFVERALAEWRTP